MAQVRILIAEDESIVALDLGMQLRACGYLVVATVKSGQAAVHQATQTHPDLVMMDIRLKGEMDGIEAARIIAAHLDIPVIFCSALVDKDTLGRIRTVKHTGYVVKPFSREKLLGAIEDALDQGGVGDS